MTPADDRPALRYQLWRQDDNGNEFLVARFDCRVDAERELARLASGGHKQRYWLTPTHSSAGSAPPAGSGP